MISTIVALYTSALAHQFPLLPKTWTFLFFSIFFFPFQQFFVSVFFFLSFPVSPVNYEEACVCLVGADDTGGEELPKPLSAFPDVVPGGRELKGTWAMC